MSRRGIAYWPTLRFSIKNEDDGVVKLLDEEPGPEHHDAVRQAALLCPAAAIRLSES